jgi:hypothetical protein
MRIQIGFVQQGESSPWSHSDQEKPRVAALWIDFEIVKVTDRRLSRSSD